MLSLQVQHINETIQVECDFVKFSYNDCKMLILLPLAPATALLASIAHPRWPEMPKLPLTQVNFDIRIQICNGGSGVFLPSF